MIEVREVRKRFGRVEALSAVSLRLDTGGTAALLGPSGSGKTTLLRLVAGLELPDAGEVLLDGAPASRPGWGIAPCERGIGFVFQTPSLWPHLTVRGNVAFAVSRRGRAERRLRVEQTLAQTGLGDLADRYPEELSGGEARRVALARALAPEPRILLLDEPLTNLDGPGRDQLLDLVLDAVRASGATLLYVTHRMEEAERVGGTPLRLEAGRLVTGILHSEHNPSKEREVRLRVQENTPRPTGKMPLGLLGRPRTRESSQAARGTIPSVWKRFHISDWSTR